MNNITTQDIYNMEKYRPCNLESVLLPTNYKIQFNKYIDKKSIPHLCFYGPSGTGKTTCAKIISNNITDPINIMEINASLTRGIDVIRDSVINFVTHSSIVPRIKNIDS